MNSLAFTDKPGLLNFLRRWYGAPTSPDTRLGESSNAPRELVEWHEISAQWGGVIVSHNYAIPLSELKAEGGKVSFWVENQGAWVWAFDPTSDDLAVYEREPSDGLTPWEKTGESLSEFLIHATVMEAILGAPARKIAQGVRIEWLNSERVHKIPFPAWNWPARNSCIYAGDSWLALVHASDDAPTTSDVTLAARSPENLAWADNVPEIKWRSYCETQEPMASEPLPW
ncbi:hypothetical protein [Streptomyces lavendulae]|uniref:hypothetical protein n=1 Tax=Streptomyces lavendulae TaxID=1914 RepID=UPI003828464B